MKRALLLAGACVILAAPAFAQAQQTNPLPAAQSQAQRSQAAPQNAAPSPNTNNAPNSAGAAPSTAEFVNKAAISGLFEIRSSEIALRKRAPQDRRFAEHMIGDHERIAAQLKHIVRANHIDAQVPNKLDDEHRKMLQQLRGEKGPQFEKDYDQMQQQGHREAVSLFQAYAKNGDNSALKRWAERTLPKLQEHLSMAQKLPS
jgi:putative membrane protein